MRKIKWTKKQKEVAAFVDEGLSQNDIITKGYSRAQVQRVVRAKREQSNTPPVGSNRTPPPNHPSKSPVDPLQQTRYRIDSSDLVHLGGLDAFPEDWRISQYCVLLIADTYYRTKEEMAYTGTIGQFLLDMTRLNRLLMQFDLRKEVGPVLLEKEVSDGRREEADGGA